MRNTNQANALFAAIVNRCDRSVEAGTDMVRTHRLLGMLRLYPTPPTGPRTSGMHLESKSKCKHGPRGTRLQGFFANLGDRSSWRTGQPSQAGIRRQFSE